MDTLTAARHIFGVSDVTKILLCVDVDELKKAEKKRRNEDPPVTYTAVDMLSVLTSLLDSATPKKIFFYLSVSAYGVIDISISRQDQNGS